MVAVIFLTFIHLRNAGAAEILPFPVLPGRPGIVSCLDHPNIRYAVYLPPAYSIDGEPLPIIYTLHADGNGMIREFTPVCKELNIIAIGIRGSSNTASWDVIMKEFFAVSRDIRQRVLFDPTAELVGGFSGGALNAYVFSRFRSQHVAGVVSINGWLGRTLNEGYFSTDRVLGGLLVARLKGSSDPGSKQILQ